MCLTCRFLLSIVIAILSSDNNVCYILACCLLLDPWYIDCLLWRRRPRPVGVIVPYDVTVTSVFATPWLAEASNISTVHLWSLHTYVWTDCVTRHVVRLRAISRASCAPWSLVFVQGGPKTRPLREDTFDCSQLPGLICVIFWHTSTLFYSENIY